MEYMNKCNKNLSYNFASVYEIIAFFIAYIAL
jgi:hypothetical protein